MLASRALLEASEEDPTGDRKREMGERVSRDAPPHLSGALASDTGVRGSMHHTLCMSPLGL